MGAEGDDDGSELFVFQPDQGSVQPWQSDQPEIQAAQGCLYDIYDRAGPFIRPVCRIYPVRILNQWPEPVLKLME